MIPAVTIRLENGSGDEAAIARVAGRDTKPSPARPRLIAERDGVIDAVISLRDGAVVADPFRPTADLVELLRLQAAGLRHLPPAHNGNPRARPAARIAPTRLAGGCA